LHLSFALFIVPPIPLVPPFHSVSIPPKCVENLIGPLVTLYHMRITSSGLPAPVACLSAFFFLCFQPMITRGFFFWNPAPYAFSCSFPLLLRFRFVRIFDEPFSPFFHPIHSPRTPLRFFFLGLSLCPDVQFFVRIFPPRTLWRLPLPDLGFCQCLFARLFISPPEFFFVFVPSLRPSRIFFFFSPRPSPFRHF